MTAAIIADGDPASQGLLTTRGFARHRALTLRFPTVPERAGAQPAPSLRPATPDDLSEIVRLLNRTWASHHLAAHGRLAGRFASPHAGPHHRPAAPPHRGGDDRRLHRSLGLGPAERIEIRPANPAAERSSTPLAAAKRLRQRA
jgi:hypothetical protein